MLVLKLISIKDLKHGRAQEGMKSVISGDNLKPEGVVALAGIDVVVAVAVIDTIGIASTPDIVVMQVPQSNSSF